MLKALTLAALIALGPVYPAPAHAHAHDRDGPDADTLCEAAEGDRDDVDVDVDVDVEVDADVALSPAVQRLEAAGRAFGEQMEAFGARADAICRASLTESERASRIDALWAEYAPAVSAFSMLAAELGPQIAAEAMADMDVAALTTDAMAQAETSGAMQAAQGVAVNGAWASDDPEHRETLGLVAEYALGVAADEMSEAQAPVAPASGD